MSFTAPLGLDIEEGPALGPSRQFVVDIAEVAAAIVSAPRGLIELFARLENFLEDCPGEPVIRYLGYEGLGPDLAIVDVVARIGLIAIRHQRRVRICDGDGTLRALISLAGLDGYFSWTQPAVQSPHSWSEAEMKRQSEHRENPLGVEEERECRDPATGYFENL
jgi:hypothetical protein